MRDRREQLGLSQGDIIRVLGYKSRNAVSNIEVGIEGLPAKRAYAWADVLEVPRDVFFRFVTGEIERVDLGRAKDHATESDRLSTTEAELIATYRSLPPKYQRRLREQVQEYETLARSARRSKRP
jgi:transcriptional regulator with XRE-family HTH domain